MYTYIHTDRQTRPKLYTKPLRGWSTSRSSTANRQLICIRRKTFSDLELCTQDLQNVTSSWRECGKYFFAICSGLWTVVFTRLP